MSMGSMKVRHHEEQFCLRMLGDNVQMARWQWEELHDELKPNSDLGKRIREMLRTPERRMDSVKRRFSR